MHQGHFVVDSPLPLSPEDSATSFPGAAGYLEKPTAKMLVLPLPDVSDDGAVGIWEGSWGRSLAA